MLFKKISLINQIFIAVLLGLLVGIFFVDMAQYLKVIGAIFLRLMQMSIPLLVLGQIVQALATINPRELSNIGLKTLSIFAISSLLAGFWGILFAHIFKPGAGVVFKAAEDIDISAQTLSIEETLTNFFPVNIIEALANGTIIQIIVFALFFGLAANRFMAKNKASQIKTLISDFNVIIMKVIKMVMYLAPIGVFCLVAATISETGLSVILPLLKYLLVFASATLIFMLLWIMVVSIYCRVSPMWVILGIKDMSLVAISTTSSAISLPIALEDSKNKLGVSDRIADLVMPLGVSLNSNGAAMHMAITVITIGQFYGLNFDWQTIIYIGLLSTLVSLANAVVPGAGLVSLAIIVPQVGLPVESIAIFAGVDYFVGMIRTILNVDSDVFTAMLVAKSTGEFDR